MECFTSDLIPPVVQKVNSRRPKLVKQRMWSWQTEPPTCGSLRRRSTTAPRPQAHHHPRKTAVFFLSEWRCSKEKSSVHSMCMQATHWPPPRSAAAALAPILISPTAAEAPCQTPHLFHARFSSRTQGERVIRARVSPAH